MFHPTGRLARQWETMQAMLAIYCRAQHGGGDGDDGADTLCPVCRDLLAYMERRYAHCPYGADKPSCTRCPVPCFLPAMRQQLRSIRRFARSRLFLEHPGLALLQLFDGLRPIPAPPPR